jgi:hypothetical protein
MARNRKIRKAPKSAKLRCLDRTIYCRHCSQTGTPIKSALIAENAGKREAYCPVCGKFVQAVKEGDLI